LLKALPQIRERFPLLKILFTGDRQSAIGEWEYARTLGPLLEREKADWVFLGTLDAAELPAFYGACDVTVLPSTNSTESFGMVQIESMCSGTPVVASDLPGMRVPVESTQMGLLCPPGDVPALAEAIVEVLENRNKYVKPRELVAEHFSVSNTAELYERLLNELLHEWGQ